MAAKEASLTERVQVSYKQLSLAATNLNIASDELSRAISVLETALQKLNLGVSAWTKITSGEHDESGYWWSRDIGYTQISAEWVIALRSSSGDYHHDDDSETVWPFSKAPRWMQDEAVAKIPDLIDKLTAQAEETRKKLRSRAEQTFQLAAVIDEVNKIEEDWRGKLQSAMGEAGMASSAEALAQPEVEVELVKNELKIKVPKRCQRNLGPEEIRSALEHLGHPDLRFKVVYVLDRKNTAEQSANTGKKQ
jgi:hypothetical protein